jgi:hypothetical protein
VLPDETAATALGFLTRAVAWYAALGIAVERVLTDNGLHPLSRMAWLHEGCAALSRASRARHRASPHDAQWTSTSHESPADHSAIHSVGGRRPGALSGLPTA